MDAFAFRFAVVQVGGRGIAEYTSLPIDDAVEAFEQVKLNAVKNRLRSDTARDHQPAALS
jgi:hypothetical protein